MGRTVREVGVRLAGVGGGIVPIRACKYISITEGGTPLCTIRLLSALIWPIPPICQVLDVTSAIDRNLGQCIRLTCIEERYFSSVGLPEILTLVERVLRCTPLANVGVVWIRHGI